MYADWVRESIAQNKPYSQMARERLTAQGYDGVTRHFLPYDVIGPPGETMAEEIRVFFGRRMDCAQCHNHPYEAWTQDQFWGLAAFFGRLFKMGDTGFEYVLFDHPLDQPMGNADVNGSLQMLHPRTKVPLKPTLLDGTVVESSGRENPRKALAEWMVGTRILLRQRSTAFGAIFSAEASLIQWMTSDRQIPRRIRNCSRVWLKSFGHTITICGTSSEPS